MRVPQQPGCTIDWRRVFSLPVTVPPETITPPAKVLEYLTPLDTTATNLINTYERFHVTAPGPREARSAPKAAAAGSTLTVLPRITGNVNVSDEFNIPANATDGGTASVVTKEGTPFNSNPPEAGTPVQVEGQLQRKLTRDEHSNKFSPLPIPSCGFDTIRFFFANRATTGFSGALGLNDQGLILGDGNLASTLPTLLLATRDNDGSGQPQIGEVDRLLLRAPIAGRFRFEPYYHYQLTPAATPPFRAVGPSNSGRLIFEQPPLSTRANEEKTESLVYRHRYFALEHVDRASVAPFIHRHLMLHFRFFEAIDKQFSDTIDELRLVIEESNRELLSAIVSEVNHLLRSWTAFLSILRWRAEDIAADGQIDSTWRTLFPAKDLDAKDAKKILPMVKHVLDTEALRKSLMFFSENVYSPLLAGQSWLEVLTANRATGATIQDFPVTRDKAPFTPKNPANDLIALQHHRLRRLEDPLCRWIGCYAGAPVGKPSRVYATAAPIDNEFPVNGLTTFEVEALHLAGTAATTLGVPAAAADPGPSPGKVMSLNSYVSKAQGFATYFSASQLAPNRVHTTIDFLVELTQGIHGLEKEPEFLDLQKLENPADGKGHPLLKVLRADQHNKAKHIRRQMDALNAVMVGGDTLAVHSTKWWNSRVRRPSTVSFTPTEPYDNDGTRPKRSSGVLKFFDVFPDPFGPNDPSGFSPFDLTSAYLACDRMARNAAGSPRLPLPVLMALMEREGVRLWATLNRHITFTTDPASTVTWEALARPADAPSPPPRPNTDYPPEDDHRARKAWLGYPYGLDSFAAPVVEGQAVGRVDDMANLLRGGIFEQEPNENLIKYLRNRVFSKWIAITPTHGIPQIWKRSRRAHWACLSLMAGFFRYIEERIKAPTILNEFAETGWTPDLARWLPPGSSPPALIRADQSRVLPTDVEWKDYLTYYGLIYVAYNGGPNPWKDDLPTWRALAKSAETANPAGSPLSLRDYFIFRHARDSETLQNARHFVVGLDAFLRIDFMENKNPSQYAGSNAIDTALPADRWGIPPPP